MNHSQLFVFESDFVASLRCIPMAVRFKLDRVGIKLSLRQWSRFSGEDRRTLLLTPCETSAEQEAYLEALIDLVRARCGEAARPLAPQPPPVWDQTRSAPAVVADYAISQGAPVPTPGQWSALTRLQRFVLVKLTRDNHDNVNFLPALEEFGLAGALAPAEP